MKTNTADRMNDTAVQSSERTSRPLARLADLFHRRRSPSYRTAPPLRNAHYLGLHIAATSYRSAIR